MKYIPNLPASAAFNFALEEYLCRSKKFNDTVFLLWKTTPTIMISRFQKSYEEIDYEQIKESNMEVVRRNTGGGTLYTDEGGCQFSFISKKVDDKIDFTPFINPIIKALHNLGVEVDFNSRNDLKIDGKKISGNAQTIIEGYILHHGSLLYNTDLSNLDNYLKNAKHKASPKANKKVGNIADYIPDNISADKFMEEIASEIIASGAEVYELTDEDIKAIKQIEDEKFKNDSWTFDDEKNYNFYKTSKFKGGKLEISMNIVDGIIEDCKFNGDFFAKDNVVDIEQALIGQKFDNQILKNVLSDDNLSDILYQISNDEILELLFSNEELNNDIEYY
ncbi:lipoate--protein ligase [Floricoccus penangensis]|uniref:lipoate--protein ligase n=1 Tax=Floricoccus penangensis TaxID=1859475 RepID=UPI00204222F2|nr:lipoate--protein ligase [Floricoccus penangensis]URZ86661.1 lipoate--protein ligase [Floricoccus penangensis]